MSIRICQSFRGRWKIFLPAIAVSLVALPTHADGFQVQYAPEVVFLGDPLAFQLRADERAEAAFHAADRLFATIPLTPGEVGEVSLVPAHAQRLRFALEGTEYHFRLIQPGEEHPPFSERDGFLEVDEESVILLPEHRKPPPLDRRWETMSRLLQRIRDQRPPLENILWLAQMESEASETLGKKLTAGEIIRRAPAEDAWFEVHGFLLSPTKAEDAGFIVVEVTAEDFERGMSAPEWLMKWQFVLQRIQHQSGAAEGLLLGPESSPLSGPWMPWFKENLPALAESHGLIFVDRSIPEAVWNERLLHRLDRMYLLP